MGQLMSAFTDQRQVCLLLGVDRKGPADGQSDAVDPKRTWVVLSIVIVINQRSRVTEKSCGRER